MRDKLGRFVKGYPSWSKGIKGVLKHSEETKKKISKNSAKNMLGKKHKESSKIKIRIARAKQIIPSDENHHKWKGEEACYSAKHNWVRKHKGQAKECINCKTKTSKKYDWANVSKKYHRKLDDYISLCRKCHIAWDRQQIQITI